MAYANPGRPYKSDILRDLVDTFGKTLTIGTIKDVAKKNDYDVHKSTIALLQLSAFSNKTVMPSGRTYSPVINKPRSASTSRIRNGQNYVSTFAVEETIDEIIKGFKVLVILRGLPGSGKSYLGKTIIDASIGNFTDHIFSADNFFMKNGIYVYDSTKIEEAHNWNQRNIFQKMLLGYSPLIVDNTNTRLWEMRPYARMAVQCGYKIHILEANTKWSFDCNELAKKNQHGIMKPRIRDMLERYEKNITPEVLLSRYNLSLEYQNNPQRRNYPPIVGNDELISSTNSNSSVSTSVVHNHNSMNQDLKLPDLYKILQTETPKANYSQSEVSNSVEISDDDENANTKIRDNSPTRDKPYNCFPALDFAAWGVDEKVLKSWDIVTPLNDERNEDELIDLTLTSDFIDKPQKSDQSTNTCLEDFHKKYEGSQVLNARYRNINPLGKRLCMNKPGMFDKGCSTQDDIRSDRNEDLKKLCDIFHNIPPLYIRDMYDDCKGDFDMTFEIFLEDNKDYSNIPYTKSNIIYDSDLDLNQPKKSKFDDHALLQDCTSELKNSPTSEVKSSDLDEWSKISEALYNFEIPNGPCSSIIRNVTNAVTHSSKLPSTSRHSSEENTSSPDDYMLLDSDSDLEFDNSPSQSENDNKSEDNDLIELNLGETLIEQLEKEFGDPEQNYPKGFQPLVQVPKAFARQLYASYVESVYQQMEAQKSILDKLVSEDEAFARKLQEEENGLVKECKPEGLREIMNEQVAKNIHEKEISEWKQCAPNDLAAKLTRNKLFATFPTVDRSVLLEIFHANDQDYKQTVNDLLVSVDASEVRNDTNIRDPPISSSVLQELQEANEDCGRAKEEEDVNRSYQSYRDEANNYLKRRNDMYQKAQEHYAQGHREVAQFYSQLAQKQTHFYDMANNRAATILLEEHSRRLQDFDTLDLHFLFVKEAIPALDVFIDRNINLLKGGQKNFQNLLVITGRGNRSKNGMSRIKPAVISRLRSRKIQFVQLNPGLLKIKVNRNTIMTSDL